MPTPDLPVELWLDILSYLPRSALRKMIGVNRTLFELALNDIYEEVRFISDDKDMMKTFKQLSHNNISRRVKHLFIRPAFLPGMDDTSNFRKNLEQRVSSGVTYIKNVAKKPLSKDPVDELKDPSYDILNVAKKAVKFCPNLREITITVHDHIATSLFMSFLDSLWKSDSIGPNIRKISVDTTAAKIPLFLKPITKASKVLTNLQSFEINLSTSRFQHTPTEWHDTSAALVNLFTEFRGTFTSVSFSSMVIADIGEIFDNLPRLPKLTNFELHAILNAYTFPWPQGLTRFVSRHSSTLETFIIKPHSRHVSFNHSDDAYTIWLNHEESPESKNLYSFTQLVLPKLHTLDVGLRDLNQYRVDPSLSGRALLPNLSRVTPNLTKLVMTNIRLTVRQLADTLRSLALPGEQPLLEELSFASYHLSPYIFDLLSQKLPKLKRLIIEYGYLSSNSTEVEPGYDPDVLTNKARFIDAMHARRYTKWGLLYLRLLKPSSCGCGHPSNADMKVVAASFSLDLVLGVEPAAGCQCVIYDYA